MEVVDIKRPKVPCANVPIEMALDLYFVGNINQVVKESTHHVGQTIRVYRRINYTQI